MYALSIEHFAEKHTETSEYSISDYNDQLADKITTLTGQINAANYRFLKLIAELGSYYWNIYLKKIELEYLTNT